MNQSSEMDSSQENDQLMNILKVVLEAWEGTTEVSMPSMTVVVPSDLKDD